MALIDLTNRLVTVIKDTAQFAHDVVSPPSPYHSKSLYSRIYLDASGIGSEDNAVYKSRRRYTEPPRDLREGLTQGFDAIRQGFDRIRENVQHPPATTSGKVAYSFRVLPSGIFLPLISFAHATSNVLVGTRNQLVPDARKDDQNKYKS